MVAARFQPERDTVLYDRRRRFCQGQIALLRRLDLTGKLAFTSLDDLRVARDFPEIPPGELGRQMCVFDPWGIARGGTEAVRYLSRWLVLFRPLPLLLHLREHSRSGRASTRSWPADGTCRLP
jgi:hypothetical protein